jgi:hypothetical protein
MNGHGLVQIAFELDPQEWHGCATERLWAEPVGKGRYRLMNSPFYAFGVSFEDIVFGEVREEQIGEVRGEQIYFTGVSIHGGHSTYRLWLPKSERQSAAFSAAWEPLKALGCSYEEGEVLSVDIPPSTDIHAVSALLEMGEVEGTWTFEEGHCGHLVSKRGNVSQSA